MSNPSGLRPGPECLTPLQLEALLENRADATARQHASSCPACQTELALLQEFATAAPRSEEVARVREITRKLQAQPWKQEAPAIQNWLASLFAGRWWIPATAMAAMLAFAILTIRPDQAPRIDEAGTLRATALSANQPAGDLAAPPADFAWSTVPGAARYEVQLLEVDGTVVWTGVSTQAQLAAPASLLARGKTFYWIVTAYGAGGQRLASSQRQTFRVVSR